MRNPRERLLDMLEAIERIERHAAKGRAEFEKDERYYCKYCGAKVMQTSCFRIYVNCFILLALKCASKAAISFSGKQPWKKRSICRKVATRQSSIRFARFEMSF